MDVKDISEKTLNLKKIEHRGNFITLHIFYILVSLLVAHKCSQCCPFVSSVFRSQTNIVEYVALLHKAAPGEHCALKDICSDNINFHFVL